MKTTLSTSIATMSLLAALAIPVCAVAQAGQQQPAEHVQHYKVTDLGTLEGGTFSQPFFMNSYGLVSGSSNLADGNQHATLWFEELKVDIGAPGLGEPNSIAFGNNEKFQSASRRVLSDDARKLLQQQLRFSRFGGRFMGRL